MKLKKLFGVKIEAAYRAVFSDSTPKKLLFFFHWRSRAPTRPNLSYFYAVFMRNWQNNGLMFPLGLYPLLLNRRHFAIFTVLKRSLGQGNVFRPVCLFTGGGGLPTGGLHPVGSAQEGLHLGCATRGSAWGDLHPGVCIQG